MTTKFLNINGKVLKVVCMPTSDVTLVKSPSSSHLTKFLNNSSIATPQLQLDSTSSDTGSSAIYTVSTGCNTENIQTTEVGVNTDSLPSATTKIVKKTKQTAEIGVNTDYVEILEPSLNSHTNEFSIINSPLDSELNRFLNDEYDMFNEFLLMPDDPTLMAPANTKMDRLKKMFSDCIRDSLNVDQDGNLPIHNAVLDGLPNVLKMQVHALKVRGHSIDAINSAHLTPLQLAIINNSNPMIVQILLENKADVKKIDDLGNNVLHLAVMHEVDLILFKELLQKARRAQVDLNSFNYEGFNPLLICCTKKMMDHAHLLLANGADVDAKDQKSGRTALFHAAENNQKTVVKFLLEEGANTKVKNFVGTSPHEAMFELEVPPEIKALILEQSPILRDKRKPAKRPKKALKSTVKKVKRK